MSVDLSTISDEELYEKAVTAIANSNLEFIPEEDGDLFLSAGSLFWKNIKLPKSTRVGLYKLIEKLKPFASWEC